MIVNTINDKIQLTTVERKRNKVRNKTKGRNKYLLHKGKQKRKRNKKKRNMIVIKENRTKMEKRHETEMRKSKSFNKVTTVCALK